MCFSAFVHFRVRLYSCLLWIISFKTRSKARAFFLVIAVLKVCILLPELWFLFLLQQICKGKQWRRNKTCESEEGLVAFDERVRFHSSLCLSSPTLWIMLLGVQTCIKCKRLQMTHVVYETDQMSHLSNSETKSKEKESEEQQNAEDSGVRLKRKSVNSHCSDDKEQGSNGRKLKKAKNVGFSLLVGVKSLMGFELIANCVLSSQQLAISMATKAVSFARELKSIRPDLCFIQESCALLEEENRRLRDGQYKGLRPEEDDLVRLQLEALLLAEKSRQANENSNLVRENQCLHQVAEVVPRLSVSTTWTADEGNGEDGDAVLRHQVIFSASKPRLMMSVLMEMTSGVFSRKKIKGCNQILNNFFFLPNWEELSTEPLIWVTFGETICLGVDSKLTRVVTKHLPKEVQRVETAARLAY
ncbi:hypothetical protein DVH24_027101 [Malus domestica]|uniref:Uncharacterized protein n=1 Tax=Malus domestica TaxID=3750 RepID=A0A498IQF7_MALDO|nr:hypothetical protein DVH24_027101 [Malus domestica]